MARTRPHSVVIADDHEIVRDGLKNMLTMHKRYKVVGEAEDGLQAVDKYNKLKPDLLLLDLSMPGLNGALTTKKIIKDHPEAKILILTAHYADEYLYSTLEAGACGYILKEQPADELLNAMDTVLGGDPYLSPKVSSQLISSYVAVKRQERYSPNFTTLTVREREVLALIAEERSSHDIAEQLAISIKTVEKHRSNLLKKTGVRNAGGLKHFAEKHGLLIKPKQVDVTIEV